MALRSFENARVLVTGGSSGIGLALARELLIRGAQVRIAARDEGRLRQATEDLQQIASRPGQVGWLRLDVTSDVSVEQCARAALQELGGLDVLINNAGYARCGYIDQLPAATHVEMLEVNYLGPTRMIRALLPHFLERRRGHIVNVTSMLGFMGMFGYGAYAASKYALSGYTECLRQDLLPCGVAVHLCYPPTTDTPGLARENLDKPPETWAIEGKSRAFSPDRVASALLHGVQRGRFHILIGLESWAIWLVQRFAPWLVRWLMDRVLKQHLSANPESLERLGLPPSPGKALAEQEAGKL